MDVINAQDQFYIVATAGGGDRGAVLQRDDTFAVFDRFGDIGALPVADQGLFHEGTRYLSRFVMRFNGRRPLLLSSRVKDDNELFGADLTNPDLPLGSDRVLPRDVVHLFRARFVRNGAWHERVRLWNFGQAAIRVVLTFDFAADFADIFEVRGTQRDRRGVMLPSEIEGARVRLGYRGLDREERWTTLEWTEVPAALDAGMARFECDLEPREPKALALAITCERAHRTVVPRAYDDALADTVASIESARRDYAIVESSSERFNQWVRRSAADVRMLVSCTPEGDYPYAGVPWFSTPFGRDGIITALQLLWVNPTIAAGVLRYLAATQADAVKPEQDAEPGKILHETRSSEMACLGEVPFGRYYGSIDATPLFVVLAGEYFARTGDREFIAALWPHVDRAVQWIDRYGDRDGDGFVEYARRSATGLVHQGWKDSQDAVFHADGTLADPPIALCEVQAYVYAARHQAATIAEALGHDAAADRLRHQAEQLRAAFEERFWCDEEGTYALALDGRKQRCRVRTSNAGHCLFGGIAAPERARRVAEQLVGPDLFSGWGVRTVAAGEARYNPMSYHNGSVWPHDNGMVVAGFSSYGFDSLIAAPFGGLFDTAAEVELHRLPELFCGFRRRPGEGPTLYPVACSPQAWASGVVFQMIQACLRLSVDAQGRRLSITRATLPPFLSFLRLRELRLPFGEVDLLFEQHPLDVSVTVLRKRGEFEVRVVK